MLSLVPTPAQQRNYEIQVFLDQTIFSKNSETLRAKVTIKNKAERDLRTAGLKNVRFFFSKCLLGTPCERNDDTFVSFAEIPARKIRENKSFQFEVNLADLYWKDAKINPNYTENIKNFKAVPNENIYFYAGIKTLEGYKTKNFGPVYRNGKPSGMKVQKKPIYRVVYSNIVAVTTTS
jgi:hypothetical protein